MAEEFEDGGNRKLEDILAERLRTSDMGTFFQEEELVPVMRRAITVAFFEPRTGSESFIVKVARETFEKKIRETLEPVVKGVIEDPEFMERLNEATAALLPAILLNLTQNSLGMKMSNEISNGFHDWAMANALNRLKSMGRA